MCFGGGGGSILGAILGAAAAPVAGVPVAAGLAGGGLGGALLGSGKQSSPGINVPGAPQPPQAKSELPDQTNFGAQPGAASIPTFLGVNSSQSPIQQRTRLATLGTQGSYGGISRPTQGDYAGQGVGDVAQAYYKNIALRSLTDPSGNPIAGAEISPVEWRYVTEVLGKSKQRDTLEHFLTLLTS